MCFTLSTMKVQNELNWRKYKYYVIINYVVRDKSTKNQVYNMHIVYRANNSNLRVGNFSFEKIRHSFAQNKQILFF